MKRRLLNLLSKYGPLPNSLKCAFAIIALSCPAPGLLERATVMGTLLRGIVNPSNRELDPPTVVLWEGRG